MPTPRINSYRFGKIVIDGQVHYKDVIILPNQVIGNWWRTEGHRLHPNDLEPVLAAAPDVLIVGQGTVNRMRVQPETEQALEAAGIELLTLPTDKACQVYNEMRTARCIAAALHLTC